MPRFDYECDRCGWEGTRYSSVAQRDEQECDVCQSHLYRVAHYRTLVFGIPARFREHMSFDQIHGAPGTPQREQFEQDVKSGEVSYSGPGSRWV